MINNWISTGSKWGDFIHYLSSNWLLHVGFLTCPTINALLFMCFINGHCSFMKNTHSITSGDWKAAEACTILQCWECQRDINQPQWKSVRQTCSFGLFLILLSCCLCGSIAAEIFLLTRNLLWINSAVNNLCCSALLWVVCSKAVTVPSSVSVQTLPDVVVMFLEYGTSYSMCCTFQIWWRVIVLSGDDLCTHKLAHMFISRAHF